MKRKEFLINLIKEIDYLLSDIKKNQSKLFYSSQLLFQYFDDVDDYFNFCMDNLTKRVEYAIFLEHYVLPMEED